MTKDGNLPPDGADIGEALRALSAADAGRSNTARLRDVFDDIEAAIGRGVRHEAILAELKKKGFDMEMTGFRSALQRIRKERSKKKDDSNA